MGQFERKDWKKRAHNTRQKIPSKPLNLVRECNFVLYIWSCEDASTVKLKLLRIWNCDSDAEQMCCFGPQQNLHCTVRHVSLLGNQRITGKIYTEKTCKGHQSLSYIAHVSVVTMRRVAQVHSSSATLLSRPSSSSSSSSSYFIW